VRIATTLICLFLAATAFGQDAVPKKGFVPDSATAVKIAEAVLIPVYGQQKIESEKPFTAKLKDDVWFVSGTLYCAGGQAPGQFIRLTSDCNGLLEVRISKDDGRILKIIHHK